MSNLKLNIGCGKRKLDGFVNIDICEYCEPDMLLDLDSGLDVFGADSVDFIRAEHVLEHVDDLKFVLEEMYRISKNGAYWDILVPHYSYGFVHPFHKRGFSIGTFAFFNLDSTKTYCAEIGLKLESVQFKYTRAQSFVARVLNFVVSFFANLSPRLCERIWCYWFGGFEEIQFKLKVMK